MSGTYNVTVEKAYKLIEAFPSKLMYIGAVQEADELLEKFIKPLCSSGFNVVSVARVKKQTTDFVTTLQNKINKATSPTILYGYLTIEELDQIFGQTHFSPILLYFNASTQPNKSILKSTKQYYSTLLETYERLLVILN
jgi:hypothetical protein